MSTGWVANIIQIVVGMVFASKKNIKPQKLRETFAGLETRHTVTLRCVIYL